MPISLLYGFAAALRYALFLLFFSAALSLTMGYRATLKLLALALSAALLLSSLTYPTKISATPSEMSNPTQVSIGQSASGSIVPPRNGTGDWAGSEDPAAPPIGDFIVFASRATNLVPGFQSGSSASPNIYRKVLREGAAIELISRNVNGNYPQQREGSDLSFGCIQPSTTRELSDGVYGVAFSSDAEDLVANYVKPGGGSSTRQIYLRIMPSNSSLLISVDYNSSALNNSLTNGSNGSSEQPSVALLSGSTAENTIFRVAFRSTASNLVSGQSGGMSNSIVYWRDVRVTTSGITLDPIKRSVPLAGSFEMANPTLSPSGNTLAFASTGNLSGSLSSTNRQIYTYSIPSNGGASGVFNLVSRTLPFTPSQPNSYDPANGFSDYPSLSSDGLTIGFIHYPPTDPSTGGSTLAGLNGAVRPVMAKCVLQDQQATSITCEQMNANALGTPSVGEVRAGRIDALAKYAVFSDTGTNLLGGSGGGETVAQVYLKDLDPPDNGDEKPVYLASAKDGNPGGPLGSGVESPSTGLLSRPPVALLDDPNGSVHLAYSSWSETLGAIGTPSMAAPYLFASSKPRNDPTPTPTATFTETPLPSPTPLDSPTYTPQSDSGGDDDQLPTEPGTLPPIELVNGGTIKTPPQVAIELVPNKKFVNITITLPEVTINPRLLTRSISRASGIKFTGKAAKTDPLLLEGLARSSARVRYEVEIRKSGSKQRITRISSRNSVTVRKLTPGKYTVRYKVSATIKGKTIRSKTSPPTSFTVSP